MLFGIPSLHLFTFLMFLKSCMTLRSGHLKKPQNVPGAKAVHCSKKALAERSDCNPISLSLINKYFFFKSLLADLHFMCERVC